MKQRIFIKKTHSFDPYTQKIVKKLPLLKDNIQTYLIYDLFNINEDTLRQALYKVFADPVTDTVFYDIPADYPFSLAIETLPGQFDQRADSAKQCLKLLGTEECIVYTGRLISWNDETITKEQLLKEVSNPIETREKNINILEIPTQNIIKQQFDYTKFNIFNLEELKQFHQTQGFSIGLDDLLFIQEYYKQENRPPTDTELRLFDTYWSDHCRHTTFFTELKNIEINSQYKETIETIYKEYLQDKKQLQDHKTITLMDIATKAAKVLKNKGLMKEWLITKEINAATIQKEIEINKEKQLWDILFKNETHNHPTEIEPYGGASTCLGGAIRDPLSGRAYVYQAMRVSGAADPFSTSIIKGKLLQQDICKGAAEGFSSYGNQIGLATTHISEIYHPGYVAKRMEVGFVMAAAPSKHIRREEPIAGDVVILLGGATGRDGIGGASGSSKTHTQESTQTMGAEVQKGNAVIERKIQRLFRNERVTKLIKKCNDFGAGGVAVAIGEIADSLNIYLDRIQTKYEGLNPTELAISESQERMAVVINPNDVQEFLNYCKEENLNAYTVADITEDGYLKMFYGKEKIVELKRAFLDTNGAKKQTNIHVEDTHTTNPLEEKQVLNMTNLMQSLASLKITSQKGLIEYFDSTIGTSTVLMPLGGNYQITPSEGSAQTIAGQNTPHVSLSTYGFDPHLSQWSSLHGAAYAVVESIAKIVAMGGYYKETYLTFQEYFPKLKTPKHWGLAFSALLGAYQAQKQLECAAIGGKDSMSGTFEEIEVPPTLISFAVNISTIQNTISPEFKQAGNHLYYFKHIPQKDGMPNYAQLKEAYETLHKTIQEGTIKAIKTIKHGGIPTAISIMSFGNFLGAELLLTEEETELSLQIGSLIIEGEIKNPLFKKIGKVIEIPQLIINKQHYDLKELKKAYTTTLNLLYPTDYEKENNIKYTNKTQSYKPYIKSQLKTQPTVFIPIFPGTNCEWDTANAFQKSGAKIQTLVFNNTSHIAIEESVQKMVENIKKSQIISLVGGFSAGDEPDGSAKYITAVLRNRYIQEAIHTFLLQDHLMLGICNGFQALIKSGLLPFGKIIERSNEHPTLTYNQIGRHISQIVKIKVLTENTPWLAGMKDKIYKVPVSHGEGRFYATENTLENLWKEGQITTCYLDQQDQPTMLFPHNPNASVEAIESICSTDGKIYGRMAHPERYKTGLLKNIPNITYQDIFTNGIQYFQ